MRRAALTRSVAFQATGAARFDTARHGHIRHAALPQGPTATTFPSKSRHAQLTSSAGAVISGASNESGSSTPSAPDGVRRSESGCDGKRTVGSRRSGSPELDARTESRRLNKCRMFARLYSPTTNCARNLRHFISDQPPDSSPPVDG